MQNNVHHAVIDGSRVQYQTSAEFKEWDARFLAVLPKLLALAGVGSELHDEVFDIVMQGTLTYGEAMFLAGWRLRGNPDALFDLPDAD
jgi:hypothetical protein